MVLVVDEGEDLFFGGHEGRVGLICKSQISIIVLYLDHQR